MSKAALAEFRAAWEYEFEAWEPQFGAKAVALVMQDDRSEAYSRRALHIFKLDNGKYAVVSESGCSCYTRYDAVVEVRDTKQAALAEYDKWKGYFTA